MLDFLETLALMLPPWVRWVFRPFWLSYLDSQAETWRRCLDCGGKLVRAGSQKQLGRHLGHRLGPAYALKTNEYLRIKLGWL